MGRLDGKIAIITGAARGTGAEAARLFVAEGAKVLLADVRDELGEKVASELGDVGFYRRLDVRRPEDWEAAVIAVREHFGPVDVLVNNAAILDVSAIRDTTPEKARDILETNLLGPFLGTQAVIPDMEAKGGGSIVNVASIDALEGGVGIAVYGSSKWGMRGLTKCSALELGRLRIRVNTVCPGGGSTEMKEEFVAQVTERIKSGDVDISGQPRSPMGRSATLREIALAILWLASDDSSFVNGTDVAVDGGFTAGHIFPGTPGAD
ncbi:MAG: glucose 1-dehydrogenase [Myxococcales bacterium]|nr:glucose 1-dehydrogenase [Myxococcales bacterium]